MVRARYPTQPLILDLISSLCDALTRLDNGNIIFRPGKHRGFLFIEKEFYPQQIFDLLSPTIKGLLDDLTPGSQISEEFMLEIEKINELKEDPDQYLRYGTWIYYPQGDYLVCMATKFWHRMSLMVRNSILLRDPEMKLGLPEIRNIFESSIIAITGCSLGNNVAHAITRDLRPSHIKVADQKDYNLTNANRVQLRYSDLGRNKAIVTAEQLHAIDPFMKIDVFKEGVHEGNLSEFLEDAAVVIEEADDPDIKIRIREHARNLRIPVIMASDLGSAAQIDIRRFDLDPKLPLVGCGVSDEELYKVRDQWRSDLANRSKFFEFVRAMVGKNFHLVPEFEKIIFKKEVPPFAGVPQLGSTAMVGAGLAAEATARMLLGFKLPERMFIHKHTGQSVIEGEYF